LLRRQAIVNAIMSAMLTGWHKRSATVFTAVALGASTVGAVARGVYGRAFRALHDDAILIKKARLSRWY
jgi:hypothetical protein